MAKVHIVETGYGVPMTIIHNTFDTSWDKTASAEAHYGIVYPDWSPKPSFYSTREVNNQLNGAVHIGKIFFEDNKDIQMHLFARDNKIHAAIWTKGEDVTVDLGQNVAIYDMIGNYVGNSNNVTVTEEVQYIHGLNKDWFIRGLADTMEEIYNNAIGSLDDCKDSAGFDKANEIIYSTVKEAKSLNEIPSEEEALSLLRSHYAKASQIIEMYKNNELDIPFKRLTGLLYINQLMGEKMTNMYMLSVESELNAAELTSKQEVDKMKKLMDEKRGENTLSGVLAIWKFARERMEDAYEIADKSGQNAMKSGFVKALNEQANLIIKEANDLMAVENPGNDNILLQLPSSQAKIDVGKEQTINLSLYNYRPTQGLTGYAEIYTPDGKPVGKSETVTVSGDTSIQLPVKMQIDMAYEGTFKMKFFENGEQIIERDAPIKVKDQISVKFAPMMKTFDEIEAITLNLENVYGDEVSGKVYVLPS